MLDCNGMCVLIPLNSGLVFVWHEGNSISKIDGLNPFEFRAGICLNSLIVPTTKQVLIPLNSGLVFVCSSGCG